MNKKNNLGFTLVEILVATVISAMSIAVVIYLYLFFSNSYKSLLDKAELSEFGRSSLTMISRDLRNAGYKDINYNQTWDRMIEQVDNYNNTGSDSLTIWYNNSPQDRIQIQYFLKKYDSGNEMYLAKDFIENPVTNPRYVYCERVSVQKNCSPLNIVPYVTDFQVVLRDVDGKELRPVCATCSSAQGKENQLKVHTAEIYLTVRSSNEVYKTNKIVKIINHNSSTGKEKDLDDKYHRDTFYVSTYLRNIIKN